MLFRSLDLSNLLRMMIAENVAEYIQRGKKAATALEHARAQAQQGSAAEHKLEAEPGEAEYRHFGRQRGSIIV